MDVRLKKLFVGDPRRAPRSRPPTPVLLRALWRRSSSSENDESNEDIVANLPRVRPAGLGLANDPERDLVNQDEGLLLRGGPPPSKGWGGSTNFTFDDPGLLAVPVVVLAVLEVSAVLPLS